MKIIVKMTGALRAEIVQDLSRMHPFAAERVGFVSGRIGSLGDDGRVLLLTRYHSVPDDDYIDDPRVGARIGGEAITRAMQAVYLGRQKREGLFHIHLHGHRGETAMSVTDSREIPPLIPGFQSVGRHAAHGIVILSSNHGSTWVWLPESVEPIQAMSMAVIGAPIGVFEGRRTQ